MSNLFLNNTNLEYINLLNFTDFNNPSIEYMFLGIADNTVICIDKNKATSIYSIINNKTCVSISCKHDWRDAQYKINIQTGEYIILIVIQRIIDMKLKENVMICAMLQIVKIVLVGVFKMIPPRIQNKPTRLSI